MENTLTDFGSKIGGARKDLRGNVTKDDLLRMTPEERLKHVKKDTVWPTPDYAEMVKTGGYTQRGAAMVKMLRDAFPATPMFGPKATDEQRAVGSELYVEILNAAKAITQRGRTEQELGAAFRDAPEAREFLYEASLVKSPVYGRSDELKISAGRRFNEVLEGAFAGSYDVSSDIRSCLRSFAEGRIDYKSNIALKKNPQWPEGTSRASTWLRSNHIDAGQKADGWGLTHHGRQVESGSSSYSEDVLTRMGFGGLIGKTFESKELASEEILKVVQSNLEAKQTEQRKNREKRLEKANGKSVAADGQMEGRVGPDQREGANVTGGDYLQAFGMRGGEYGLWVNQAERQDVTNKGFDSFCDIADAFKLPHESVSLGGTLAIAFGARGRGGWAAATYGPDRRVINLTKPSGEGCLAHEWGHALDHWLGTRADALGLVDRVKDPEHAKYLTNVHLKPVSDSKPETGETKYLRDFHEAIRTIWTNKEPVTKDEVVSESLERREVSLRNLMITVANLRHNLGGKPERLEVLKPYIESLRKPEENNELDSINKAVDGVLQMTEFRSSGFRSDVVKYHEWAAQAVAATAQLKALPDDWTGPSKVRNTAYKRQVNALDTENKKAYYAEPHEMFARTFESVLQDTLTEKGQSNPFLVNTTSGDAFPKNRERKELKNRLGPLVERLKEYLPKVAMHLMPQQELSVAADPEIDDGEKTVILAPVAPPTPIIPERRPDLPNPVMQSFSGPQMNLF